MHRRFAIRRAERHISSALHVLEHHLRECILRAYALDEAADAHHHASQGVDVNRADAARSRLRLDLRAYWSGVFDACEGLAALAVTLRGDVPLSSDACGLGLTATDMGALARFCDAADRMLRLELSGEQPRTSTLFPTGLVG